MTRTVEAATGGESGPAGGALQPRQSRYLLGAAHTVIALALSSQFVFLVLRSRAQYDSGAVAMDFAIFHQAWAQMASGVLSPYSTIVNHAYWQSHFELLMWPLSLVGTVFPSGVTLLVVQDLAIVASEAVALLWALEVVRRGRTMRPWHLLPVLTALLLLVTSNRIRVAALSDFHFQPFATFLLLGGARALWRGNTRKAWYWLLPVLLTGDVAGTYVAGVGLSAVVARRDTRRTGLAMIAVGAGWTVFVGLLGANRGSAIAGYQHLVDDPLPASGGALLAVLAVLLLHPSRPLSVLWSKLDLFGADLAGTGLLGVLHPWTFGVVAAVMVASGLQESVVFFSPFQNFPAIMFATVGTAMVLDWTGRRAETAHTSSGIGRPAMVSAVVVVALVAVLGSPAAGPGFPEPPGAAADLAAVDRELRSEDQVVASFGIVGRFAGREHVRMFFVPGPVPVEAARVVFVFSWTIGNVPTAAAQEAAAEAVRALGVTPIVDTADVKAFVWSPPPGTEQIALPG